jgi:hypothetical protein
VRAAPRRPGPAEAGTALALGAAGLAVRLAFLWRQAGELDADSATIGLMARHILAGRHYAFFWGQGYMGSVEAYVAALGFALLGAGDIALQLAPLALSAGFTVAAYVWARRLGGPPAALVTLALLAVGPPTLTLWQVTPRGGYAATLALGTVVMLIATDLGERGAGGAGRRWVALGLVAGLAFWTHLLSGVYLLAAAAYLLLRDPRRLTGRGPWLALAAFALGSLPLWLHNVANGFVTFTLLAPPRPLDLWANLSVALADSLPKLLGARALTHGEALLPVALVGVVAGVPIAALAWFGGHLARALGAGRRPPDLLAGLLLLATAGAVLLSPYGIVPSQRYWLPIFSALPVLVGLWLARLPRPITLVVPAALGAIHLASHLSFVPLSQPDHPAIARALVALGVRDAYADYWAAAPLTHYANGALTVADLHGEWYPLRERPDFSPLPAIIVPASDRVHAATLRLAGVPFREQRVGAYRVYRPAALPGARRRALARQAMRADAWPNGADAARALDGDPGTRWRTGRAQQGGMWLQVDLGDPVRVSGVRLEVGPHTLEYPRTIRVEVSPDGARWQTVALARHGLWPGLRVTGSALRHDARRADVDVRFAPVPARVLRVSIPPRAAVRTPFGWSIGELHVFGPADPAGPERRADGPGPASPR